MSNNIILASKSKVRKEILDKHHILCEVKPSNVDEDVVKESLINELATPEIISKNLAELKANKVSLNQKDKIVLGADSVIDLDGELISKPESREEALIILKKLKDNPQLTCVVGLNTEPERLVDLRKNRMNSLKETENTKYINIENIKKEIEDAKKTFQKYKWPSIDVTRKSVEETAASIIKIHEIYLNNVK